MAGVLPTVNSVPAYRLSVRWGLGEPEDISYTVYGPDAAALSAGGAAPAGGILPVSFGPGGVDARLLSTGAELVYDQPGYVTESGKSIGLALAQAGKIHRFTAQQISLADAISGEANAIHLRAEEPHVIARSTLPDQAGIAHTPIGATAAQHAALAFAFVVDGSLADVVLDIDINEDNVLHALQVITDRLGSFVDPQHTQVVIDSGDLGPDGPKTVSVGRKGGGSVSFGSDAAPLLRGSTAQQQTTDLCASVTFVGGDTHHGLPATGKLMDLRTLTNGIPLVAVYSSAEVGGVYFWRGDGAFYPASQAMGVNALWYEGTEGDIVYAATDAGVYFGSADVRSTSAYQRLGFMSLKCSQVQYDQGHVYCLAEFSASSERHVLKYQLSSMEGLGYDGWKQVVSTAGIGAFAVMGDYCYCTMQHSASTLLVHQFSTGTESTITLATGAAILGLDPISTTGYSTQRVIVRTNQGAAEIYALVGVTLSAVNADHTLVDDLDAPVMVNSIRANPDGYLDCSTGQVPSALLAATSLGVFSCPDPTGAGKWERTDGQSSIGDFSAAWVAVGDEYIVDGHTVHNVYAASDSALYVSHNGSVNWVEALSAPLDAGPYFWDHFWRLGRFPFPTETTIAVPYGGVTYQLRRTLDGINVWCYELVNPASASPSGQHRSAELSEISTPALMSPITAARALVEGMARFLAYTSRPQTIVEVASYFDTPDSPLRTLRPCMDAPVSGEALDLLIGPDGGPFSLGTLAGSFYVLEHTISYDRDSDPSGCTTRTRLGSLLLADRTDPLKVTADLFYQVSRQQRYRSRSRR